MNIIFKYKLNIVYNDTIYVLYYKNKTYYLASSGSFLYKDIRTTILCNKENYGYSAELYTIGEKYNMEFHEESEEANVDSVFLLSKIKYHRRMLKINNLWK